MEPISLENTIEKNRDDKDSENEDKKSYLHYHIRPKRKLLTRKKVDRNVDQTIEDSFFF